jgi:hypothetical protein
VGSHKSSDDETYEQAVRTAGGDLFDQVVRDLLFEFWRMVVDPVQRRKELSIGREYHTYYTRSLPRNANMLIRL